MKVENKQNNELSSIKVSDLQSTSVLNDRDLILLTQYDENAKTNYVSKCIALSDFISQIEERIQGNIGILTFVRNPLCGDFETGYQTYKVKEHFSIRTVQQLGWENEEYEFKFWQCSDGKTYQNGDNVTFTDKEISLSGVWDNISHTGTIYFNSNYPQQTI